MVNISFILLFLGQKIELYLSNKWIQKVIHDCLTWITVNWITWLFVLCLLCASFAFMSSAADVTDCVSQLELLHSRCIFMLCDQVFFPLWFPVRSTRPDTVRCMSTASSFSWQPAESGFLQPAECKPPDGSSWCFLSPRRLQEAPWCLYQRAAALPGRAPPAALCLGHLGPACLQLQIIPLLTCLYCTDPLPGTALSSASVASCLQSPAGGSRGSGVWSLRHVRPELYLGEKAEEGRVCCTGERGCLDTPRPPGACLRSAPRGRGVSAGASTDLFCCCALSVWVEAEGDGAAFIGLCLTLDFTVRVAFSVTSSLQEAGLASCWPNLSFCLWASFTSSGSSSGASFRGRLTAGSQPLSLSQAWVIWAATSPTVRCPPGSPERP